jgi:hypothetical protein
VAQQHGVRTGRHLDDGLVRLDDHKGLVSFERGVLLDQPFRQDRFGRSGRDFRYAQQ